MKNHYDICVQGGGIVGQTLALLLARERLSVALVASTPPAAAGPDVRAYALNARSRALLTSVRCWPDAQHATPVAQMRVQGDDGGAVSFDAPELGVEALTWIVDVPALQEQLSSAVRFQPQIDRLTEPRPATLTVVCEGRSSATREALGVVYAASAYSQHAVATRLDCELPHGQVARQWFTPGEILAFLPLDGPQGRQVAVVWSVQQHRVAEVRASAEDVFCAELGRISDQALGRLRLASPRRSWPLVNAQASRWIGVSAEGRTWALAGDAAHAVHPLAGQGLNLGLGDVAELADTLARRPYWRGVNDLRLLRAYERARRAEVSTAALAMDGLQQLFAHPHPALQSLRNWGLKGFERSALAKQWAARRAMGL